MILNFNPDNQIDHKLTTNDNTQSLLPLEAILPDIYRVVGGITPFSEDDLLESAAFALEHLLTYKMYEKVACLKVINEHTVEIDEPFSEVEAVLYSPTLDDEDLEEMIQTATVNICTQTATKKNLYSLLKCSCFSKWKWLNLGHSIAAMMQDCSGNIPPIGCACNDSFTVKGNTVSISQKDGYVIVLYKRALKDDSTRLPMMPNHPLVKSAIKAHVLMEIYERKMNMSEDGSISLYDRYFKQWEILSAASVGELVKPTLPEWIEIVKLNRFFKDDSPYRIFDQIGFERFNPH